MYAFRRMTDLLDKRQMPVNKRLIAPIETWRIRWFSFVALLLVFVGWLFVAAGRLPPRFLVGCLSHKVDLLGLSVGCLSLSVGRLDWSVGCLGMSAGLRGSCTWRFEVVGSL